MKSRLSGAAGTSAPTPPNDSPSRDELPTVSEFHRIWYDSRVWERLHWVGIPIQKNPFDLFQYQEVIWEQRPDFLIECGALYGGATLFFAQIFELLGHGKVISIDTNPRWDFRARDHPRVTTITGSSTETATLSEIREIVPVGSHVMVILDSDHTRDHVLRELEIYSELLQPGDLLVVEDTDINGHPVLPQHGPGPYEAVEIFRQRHPEFRLDQQRESKLLFTSAPRGWLRRRRGAKTDMEIPP